ncbi:MAG: hypothetical protein HFG71_03460 [Hungatella sp.]|jgi:hypothetical protein|nr:hypothetical protein [Hungatella sp.]
MEKKRAGVWQYRWKEEVIIAGLLLAFGFIINAGIQIRGLFMDDLYLWSCYGEQTFREFVFPLGSTRFRFLYNLAAYVQLGLVGSHVTWFVPINIILNSAIAYTICRFARTLSGNTIIGFLTGFLYLLSRMSYYQISQVYGLMESLALWASIGILYCLYRYINEPGQELIWFRMANGLYFAVCFIHERYMVFLPLLFLVLLMKRNKKWREWAIPLAVFALVQLIRLAAIGTVMPAGTGGTDVADTLNIKQVILFAVQQVLYLFGINTGGSYLCALSWRESSRWIKVLVILADMMILAVMIIFIIKVVRSKWERMAICRNCLLFFLFIGACIACSSVTIRVEVRWVYVSMAAAWLWLAYMCGVIARPLAQKPEAARRVPDYRWALICTGLAVMYTGLMIPAETYYRNRYSNLYYWNSQQQYNSLAEQTYEKYGEAVFGKKIYILKNTYDVSKFYADTFFKVFDKDRKAEGTEVIFVDNIRDFGQVNNNMLVIREDPSFHAYQDITEAVRILKCEPIYGYYRDGWMDESAKLRVMAGSSGVIQLQLMYPGAMDGHEKAVIYQNGQPAAQVEIKQNITQVELKARPYDIVELEFENNFYLEDAQEQRGEKRFSMMVEITAD